MGKRKRHNEVNAEGGVPNPLIDKRGTINKKESTASAANEENFDNVELKAAHSSQKRSPRVVVKAGKGRKCVNSKAAPKGGEAGAKKVFNWSSAQETIALSELAKLTNADASQSLDNNSSIDWEQLAATVGERLDCIVTRTQMYEKVRRLKERYKRMKRLSRGKLHTFKNEDDKKMFKMSQQIWGTSGTTGLEEERNLQSGDLEKKFSDVDNIHKDKSLPGVTIDRETAPRKHQRDGTSPSEPKQGMTSAREPANPDLDLGSQSKMNAVEGDTQKTFEVFHAEHHALLKELEKSCTTVLQDMQVKFLSMMNNTIRGSQFAWMGVGAHVPSFDFIMQTPLSWDKLVDNRLSTSTNKPAAFENLYEQWQQQRLQELKLMSIKLQLMLEDCKMEQEKLEKQVLKSD